MATVHFRCPPPPMPVSPPPGIQSKRTWTRSIAHRRRCRRRDSIAPAHTKGTAPRIQSLPGDVLRGASRMRLAGWTRRGREPADECIPMSAYRYYEFLAVARSLDERGMSDLRSISSRAEITPTSVIDEYGFGDLKTDPVDLLERYFDVFDHVSRWSTRRLALRLPREAMTPEDTALVASGMKPRSGRLESTSSSTCSADPMVLKPGPTAGAGCPRSPACVRRWLGTTCVPSTTSPVSPSVSAPRENHTRKWSFIRRFDRTHPRNEAP